MEEASAALLALMSGGFEEGAQTTEQSTAPGTSDQSLADGSTQTTLAQFPSSAGTEIVSVDKWKEQSGAEIGESSGAQAQGMGMAYAKPMAKRRKLNETTDASSGTQEFDVLKVRAQAMESGSPAIKALLEAMDLMHAEVAGAKDELEQLDSMQLALSSSTQPGLAASSELQTGASSGNQELDPQELFKAAEMLQRQAAWWDTAANLQDNMPSGLMTFSIDPTGPTDDYNKSAGGWGRPANNADSGKKTDSGQKKESKFKDGQPIIATQRIYTGYVKEFDANKKGGFIECDELRQGMGQDVYVHQNVLTQARAGVSDMVGFPLHVSHKGKLQASSPMCRLATNVGFAHTGVYHPSSLKNEPKVSGEIHCQLVQKFFGCYVKVSKEIAKSLLFGRRVGFNFIVDADGACHAYTASMVEDDYLPTPGVLN